MLNQAKQVALTYLTWRWIWFVSAIFVCSVIAGFAGSKEAFGFALGMPGMMGLIWLAAVVKWQFANPRARLMPGYSASHLGIFGVLLLCFFVIYPLLLAYAHSMSPWGLLAYSLSLASCILASILLGRGFFMLPAMAIFFSSYSEQTHWFWFGDASSYNFLRIALVAAGASIISFCFWYLTQLTEEMDEYQTMPIGGMRSSRVERAEQRRLMGNMIKKQKLMSKLSDRWLEGLVKKQASHHGIELAEYSFARISSPLAAITTCIGFTLYALLLVQLDFMRVTSEDVPHAMFIVFTLTIPAAMAGAAMMQHRQRMGQELLRPASRTDYFDNLFIALAKRCMMIWIGTHVSLGMIAYLTNAYPKQNCLELALAFLTISLATTIPAFSLSMRIGQIQSQFSFMLGMYLVVGLQMGTISLWWYNHDKWGIALELLLAVFHLMLGIAITVWTRRSWLDAELA